MTFWSRHKNLLKLCGTTTLTFGTVWFVKQVKKTYDALNNVLDTSVVNFLEPAKYPDVNDSDADDESEDINYLNVSDFNFEPKQNMWKTLKFIYARQILKWANSDKGFVRKNAVKQLINIRNLDNWHYSYLGQQLNAKTAVTLARMQDIDYRYFPKPPLRYLTYSYEMLVKCMKDLLSSLNDESPHACVEYFIKKALEEDPAQHFIEYKSMSELRKLIKSASDILPLCLESLLHHSSLGNNAHDIIHLDGLPLLMELYNRFEDDLDINIKLCNILAFISIYPNVVEDFYNTGWVTVLSKWIHDNDIRLSSTAAKILSNLDDNNYKAVYQNSMHVLYPLYHCDKKALVDVIFVHGLLGGVFFTWRQRKNNKIGGLFSSSLFKITTTDIHAKLLRTSDPIVREYIQDAEVKDQYGWDQVGQDFEFVLNDIPTATNIEADGPYTCCGTDNCIGQAAEDCCANTSCWPREWLPLDCKDLRILGINYDTSLSLWAQICPNEQKKCTIEERSDEFLASLLEAGVGDRPIIWITHSMGGLIIKNMLWRAWESNSKPAKNLCSNSKGIVFYSTPHIGSRVANLNATASLLLWPSVEIQELREDSQGLYKIHENFLKLMKHVPLKVISFVETKSTLVTGIKFHLLFVDPHSGNPSIGEYFEVPQDHLGICKPANRMSFLYQKVLHFIQEIVEDTKVRNQINIGFEQ